MAGTSLATAYTRVLMDTSGLKAGINEAVGKVKTGASKMSSAFLKVGKVAAKLGGILGGVAVGFVLTRAIKEAARFESALADMVKVSNESFDAIREKIQSIDPALGTSTELVKGYYMVISAGVKDPVEALEFLTTASKFAKAAHIDQATAVEVLAKVMNGYAGDLGTAADAADLLFAIEAQGIVAVEALVPIIGDLATMSKSLGVETWELGGALAELTKVSGSASMAGTQYRAVMVELSKGSTVLNEALKALGVSSGKQLIAQEGLAGALKKLNEAARAQGKELKDLFGSSEAMNAINTLMKNSFADLNTTMEAVKNSTGGLDKAWRAYEKTFAAVKEKFDNTIVVILTQLGTELLPYATAALERFGDWFYKNKDNIIATARTIINGVAEMAMGVASIIDFFITTNDEHLAEMKRKVESDLKHLEGVIKNHVERSKKWFGGGYTSAKLDLLRKEAARLKEELRWLEMGIKKTAGTSKDFTKRLVETKNKFDKLTEATKNIKKPLESVTKETAKLDDEVKKIVKTMPDFVSSTEDLYIAIGKTENEFGLYIKTLKDGKKASQDLTDIGDEIVNIFEAEAEAARLVAEELKKAEEVKREYILTNGGFVAGIVLGWKEITTATIEWGREGHRIITEYAAMIQGALGESLFHGIKGNWDEIKNVWKSLMDSMLRMATDMVVRAVLEFAKLKLINVFKGVSAGAGAASTAISGIGTASTAAGMSAAAMGSAGVVATEAIASGALSANTAISGTALASGTATKGFGGMAAGMAGYATAAAAAMMVGYGLYKSIKDIPGVLDQMNETRSGTQHMSAEWIQLTQTMRGFHVATINIQGELGVLKNQLDGNWTTVDFKFGTKWDQVMGQIQGLIERGDKPILIDVMTDLIDNATIPMRQKFEALGLVAGAEGWGSDVTLTTLAKFVDQGMSMKDLMAMLGEFGVSKELIAKIQATLDPIVADKQSFNNFMQEADKDSFNKFLMQGDKESFNQYEMLANRDSFEGFEMKAKRDSFENFEMKGKKDTFNNYLMEGDIDKFNQFLMDPSKGFPGDMKMGYGGPETLGYHGPTHIKLDTAGMADGGTPAPGTLTWVGERGAELAYFPNGGQVWPHGQSMAMANQINTQGGGIGNAADGMNTVTPVIENKVVHLHLEIGGKEVDKYVIDLSQQHRLKAERAAASGVARTRKI